MTLTVAPCARLQTDDRHACELPPGHAGDCSCRCDLCLGRADRLAAY